MLRLLKVSGYSLTPGYQEGDFVFIVKIPLFLRPYKVGDVVVFDHPQYGKLIKQVQAVVPERKELMVTGTHPHSIDSRQLGPINQDSILGRVIWHIKKPGMP